jgi:hypothetical protein
MSRRRRHASRARTSDSGDAVAHLREVAHDVDVLAERIRHAVADDRRRDAARLKGPTQRTTPYYGPERRSKRQ